MIDPAQGMILPQSNISIKLWNSLSALSILYQLLLLPPVLFAQFGQLLQQVLV